jgi:UPF0716 family protein affecting phage T7 exclusion
VTRRITIFLSLVTIAVGAWLISTEHGIASVCSANTATGLGIGAKCVSAVSSYFIGFALVAGGFVIFTLAFLLMAKRDKTIYRRQKATISRLHREEDERRRNAA